MGGVVCFVCLDTGVDNGTLTSSACVSFFVGGPGHSGSRAASSGERDTEYLPSGIACLRHVPTCRILVTTRHRLLLL